MDFDWDDIDKEFINPKDFVKWKKFGWSRLFGYLPLNKHKGTL